MAHPRIDAEKEIEKLNFLPNFKEFIDICTKYHLKNIKRRSLQNYVFL